MLRADTEALCDLLGVTHPVLSELKAKGVLAPIGKDAWDVRATVRAYTGHLRATAAGRGGEESVAALTAARARLAEEQADGQAMRNAALRGELLEAEKVARAWADLLRQLRSRLLAIPSRVRADLGLGGPAAEAIDRAVRDALEELGRTETAGGDDDDG